MALSLIGTSFKINYIILQYVIRRNIHNDYLRKKIEAFQASRYCLCYFRCQSSESPDAAKEIKEGGEVEVDFSAGRIRDISSGKSYEMAVFPPFLQDMIDKGGLIAFVNESLEKNGR